MSSPIVVVSKDLQNSISSSILFLCIYLTYTRNSARLAISVDSSNCIENVGLERSRFTTFSSMYDEMLTIRLFTDGADKAMLLNWFAISAPKIVVTVSTIDDLTSSYAVTFT
jgi:hypothetical protein